MHLVQDTFPGGSLDKDWPTLAQIPFRFWELLLAYDPQSADRDVTGGFRVWKRSLLESMPLDQIRSNGYVFQVEMIYVAMKLGCKAVEIPFYFADRKIGSSKMSFRIQAEAAINVWRLLGMHKGIKSI